MSDAWDRMIRLWRSSQNRTKHNGAEDQDSIVRAKRLFFDGPEFRVWRGPSGLWVASCNSLGITAQGETWADLQEEIEEAVELRMGDEDD